MQATINTMFANKKIIRIYLFCPLSSWNTKQMHCKRSIVTKTSHPPPDPLKFPTVQGGGKGKGIWIIYIWYQGEIEFAQGKKEMLWTLIYNHFISLHVSNFLTFVKKWKISQTRSSISCKLLREKMFTFWLNRLMRNFAIFLGHFCGTIFPFCRKPFIEHFWNTVIFTIYTWYYRISRLLKIIF